MIRSEHAIASYDFHQRLVVPDRLRRQTDGVYLTAVARCLERYRGGKGRIRKELHAEVEECLGAIAGCTPRRVAAFCKLLDDASEFAQASGKAATLRRRVFSLASGMHPLVTEQAAGFETTLPTARQAIAAQLNVSWEEIEDQLFADVIELQKLRGFDQDLQPADLLARYNVAQTQAVLYRATRVWIEASSQAPYLIRQAKLAGLMHRVSRLASKHRQGTSVYRLTLDGPTSNLRETTRYGVRFAKMIPALLTCQNWQLDAEILGVGNRLFRFHLSPADGLTSSATAPPDFDSELEKRIAETWYKHPVEGWTLARDQDFLVQGQQIYTPDFVLTHRDGAKIYVEVVGYWTPEYLREKQQRLQQFSALPQAKDRWLLMFDRPPTATKRAALEPLSIPAVVVAKVKEPTAWIAAALAKPLDLGTSKRSD